MDESNDSSNTIVRLIARLNRNNRSASVLRMANRVLQRAEPIARAACYSEGRGIPPVRLEELVQDTLETVWKKMEEYDPDASFEGWVRAIARNVCRNERRRKRDLLTDDGVLEATDPAHTALRSMLREQRDAVLTSAIEAALDGIEQDVVYYRYIKGYERKKIAALLELPNADEVRKILFSAMRRLKKEIGRRLEALGHGPSLMLSSSEG